MSSFLNCIIDIAILWLSVLYFCGLLLHIYFFCQNASEKMNMKIMQIIFDWLRVCLDS